MTNEPILRLNNTPNGVLKRAIDAQNFVNLVCGSSNQESRGIATRLKEMCRSLHVAKNQHVGKPFGLSAVCRLFVLIAVSQLGATASAQIRDGFESGPPRLRMWYSDTRSQITSQELTSIMPYSGQSSEAVEVNCTSGKFLYLAYPIRPAALIPELTCSVFLRAAPRGLRVGFRVVLPKSVHPASGAPTTLILFGSSNDGRGNWSRLEINNVMSTYEDQRRILNRDMGYVVDTTNAYVDAVVFDVYNGPGSTRFQIDDLAVDGLVDAVQSSNGVEVGMSAESSDRSAPVDLNTQVVRFQHSVPRLIQYNGESIDWLKSLGFTGVLAEKDPPVELLNHAANISMQVIAPPPSSAVASSNSVPGSITSWHLSSAATLVDLENTRQLSLQTNSFTPAMIRPRFVEAMESHALFSRLSDIIAFPIPLPSTVNSNAQSDLILSEQLRQVGPRALPMASVVLQPPYSWSAQCYSLRTQLQRSGRYVGNETEMANAVQFRQQVARAIALGVRGFLFRSTSQLDSGIDRELARARMMDAANSELELLRPWLESGLAPQPVPQITNALYAGRSISTERSTLFVFTTQGEFDQIAPVSSAGTPLEFIIPRRNGGEQAYRITQGGLESLAPAPRQEGLGLKINNPSMVEYVVVTNDRAVLQYLQSSLPKYARKIVSNRIESAGNYLTLVQDVLHQEGVPAGDPWWAKVQAAEAAMRNADAYQTQGNLIAAIRDSETSTAESLEVLRASWLRAVANYKDPRSSPFLTNLTSLPLAWQVERLIRNRTWQPHPVPGSEFISLQQMTNLGWAHERRMMDRVRNEFSIVERAGKDGNTAMVVVASSIAGDPIPGGFAGSSMHIRSPEIENYLGRVVCIRGRIKIDKISQEPLAGVLLYDNLGGSALGLPISADASTIGLPISANANSIGQWQEFEMYRLVNQNEPLRFFIDVRGEVTASLDRLAVESITMLPSGNYVTVPSNP